MDLGRGLGGPDHSRAPTRPIDPRGQVGLTRVRLRGLGFSDGEAESVERSVAVGFGAVELLRERAVEIEAGAGEGFEWPAVAPIEGEESACFSGGGASDGGFLNESDDGAVFG